MDRSTQVLVRGAGDVGSAVAMLLYHAGYGIALHDEPTTAIPRRGMDFADAMFDGWASLGGLTAIRVETLTELRHAVALGEVVPVAVTPFRDTVAAMSWAVLVDARMRKREVPEEQRGIAPLTIGLGPNFVAGGNVDIAIQTMWGDRLGAVIDVGPNAAVARPIGGGRFVLTPEAGHFVTDAIRGLGERPKRIAEGVLKALTRAPVA